MADHASTTPSGVSKTPNLGTDSATRADAEPDVAVAGPFGRHDASARAPKTRRSRPSEGAGVVTRGKKGRRAAAQMTGPTPRVFIIEGVGYPTLDMPCKLEWRAMAYEKGFDLLGRAKDRYHLVLRCHICGALSLVRLSVVMGHRALCHPCIRVRHEAEAAAIGAQMLGRDPDHRHWCYLRLNCGHVVRKQYAHLKDAADGVRAVGCETCIEERYAAEAVKHGWTLIGAAEGGRPGYRNYRHGCDHRQDVMVGNMLWGDCTCAACGVGWSAKESAIYLFSIPLDGLPVLKLGFSARPEKRLRHQLGVDLGLGAEVLREVPMPKGNRANAEECACHRHMKMCHPDFVVPKAEFGDRINTKGEIYRVEALEILNVLMDGVAARYRTT